MKAAFSIAQENLVNRYNIKASEKAAPWDYSNLEENRYSLN